MLRSLAVCATFLLTTHTYAAQDQPINIVVPQCMVEAADTYSIPLRALIAVWLTEGGKIGTQSRNTNDTTDYGPMQINTTWANRLDRQYGITRDLLTNDFCWSVRSGAYILRYEINNANGSLWDGIGHYHSRTPKYKYPYIARVYKNSLRF